MSDGLKFIGGASIQAIIGFALIEVGNYPAQCIGGLFLCGAFWWLLGFAAWAALEIENKSERD